MTGFALLLGHLVGDFVLQNDWMAGNKTNPYPGPAPAHPYPNGLPVITRRWTVDADPSDLPGFQAAMAARNAKLAEANALEAEVKERLNNYDVLYAAYRQRLEIWRRGHWACAVHCACYTLAVWAFTWAWMPWWGLLACFALHWPVDRFRLAAWWMRTPLARQSFFASDQHSLFPWSVVVVDNIFHLLTLYVIALLAGQS